MLFLLFANHFHSTYPPPASSFCPFQDPSLILFPHPSIFLCPLFSLSFPLLFLLHVLPLFFLSFPFLLLLHVLPFFYLSFPFLFLFQVLPLFSLSFPFSFSSMSSLCSSYPFFSLSPPCPPFVLPILSFLFLLHVLPLFFLFFPILFLFHVLPRWETKNVHPHTPLRMMEVAICIHFSGDLMSDLVICKQIKQYGHTWHWMCLLRIGIIKQHKTQTQAFTFLPWISRCFIKDVLTLHLSLAGSTSTFAQRRSRCSIGYLAECKNANASATWMHCKRTLWTKTLTERTHNWWGYLIYEESLSFYPEITKYSWKWLHDYKLCWHFMSAFCINNQINPRIMSTLWSDRTTVQLLYTCFHWYPKK